MFLANDLIFLTLTITNIILKQSDFQKKEWPMAL